MIQRRPSSSSSFFFFFLLLLFILLECCLGYYNREIQYYYYKEIEPVIQEQENACKKALTQANDQIDQGEEEFKVEKEKYNDERNVVIDQKRQRVNRYLQDLQAKLDQDCDKFLNNRKKNKYQNCIKQNTKKYVNQTTIRKEANNLRRFTATLAEQYLGKSSELIAKLEGERIKLDETLESIERMFKQITEDFHDHFGSKYSGSRYNVMDAKSHLGDPFARQQKDIYKQLAKLQSLIDLLRSFKGDLESIVYGTMCFDVIGATSIIDTPLERKVFQELTEDAIEVACAELELDADLVVMRIVKQELKSNIDAADTDSGKDSTHKPVSSKIIAKEHYDPTSATRQGSNKLRRHTRNLEANNNNNNNNNNGLLRTTEAMQEQDDNRELVNKFKLRVGTLVGVICRCTEDSPMSDVWLRRQRRGLLEKENGNDISQQEQQQLEEIQENDNNFNNLESQEMAAAVVPSSFVGDKYHDNNNNNNGEPIVHIHHDLLLYKEATGGRRLSRTKFQERYIQALNDALRTTALAGIVEVEQIECEGFLDEDEALAYIRNLK